MNAKSGIAMISPYPELTLTAREVADEMKLAVNIVEEALERGVTAARDFEKNKVECIISRGATGVFIKNIVSIPVILIQITPYDALQAFYRAKEVGRKIAFFEHISRKSFYEKSNLLKILHLQERAKPFYYEDRSMLEAQVDAAAAWKADVVVATGECTIRMAREKGMQGVMVYSSREAIVDAFQRAADLLAIRQKDLEMAEFLQAIIDNTETGVLALDRQNRISHFNPIAENLIGLKQKEIVGRPMAEISGLYYEFKEFLDPGCIEPSKVIDIRGNRILANRIALQNRSKPFGVMVTLQRVSKIQKLEAKIRRELYTKGLVSRFTFDDIAARSASIKNAVLRARGYAKTNSTVLITGESGTGKELFAHSIHTAGLRSDGPFVAVNCAAIPENLLESELFGYDEGAFTGAQKGGKPGLFELAHGGTLFLDEISEMPLSLQSRLLRVLQEKAVRRLGGDRLVPVDVRIIAATNRDLTRMLMDNQFRRDLFFRLNVLQLNIPPLRNRKEDIIFLFKYFVKTAYSPAAVDFEFSETIQRWLERYPWPGNVRELANFVEKYVTLSEVSSNPLNTLNDLIKELYSFGSEYIAEDDQAAPEKGKIVISMGTMEEMEQEIIEKTQQMHPAENKVEIAKRLGISRTTLWKKLRMPDNNSTGAGEA